ncbi:MAG: DUF1566 domain-containing protein [Xanthomonadales bacterium]|nr:DUF1566 domain-containing protein [Xanthomonadales bacterium]
MKPHTLITTVVSALLAACGQDAVTVALDDPHRFRAVDGSGAVLDSLPARWNCVLDQLTGLTWEVKTDQPGLHDWRNTYSWYAPEEAHDELDYRGTPDGGQCAGSDCDTHSLVQAVNQQGWCGHHDWRMPTRDELASISDVRLADEPPTTYTGVFRNAQAAEYWSGNDYSFQWDAAWAWNFRFGHDRVEWKATPMHVRLVRGESVNVERVKD